MKAHLVICLSFFLPSLFWSQSLYDPSSIQVIRITFPFSDWDRKLDSLHSVDSDARLLATKVELNGVVFDSVGIRYKGNSTYNASRNKNPFNIKLDAFKQDQHYQGIQTLKLSNGFMDPSFLREVLGYHITRQYLPASRANFIQVYVNTAYIGLYTNVEDISMDFLMEHFYSSSHSFFQCDRSDKPVQLPLTCPPGQAGSALKYVSSDSNCYYNNYELESPSGWDKLVGLLFTLNQNINEIEPYLDVDRALWMLALNDFYVNLDSYSGSGHNYLIYENHLGRFNTIPWDLNEYYGAFTNAGTGSALTLIQMQQLDPLLHVNNPERPLISKLFYIPKWKRRYLAHLNTVLDDAKNSNGYEQVASAFQSLIRNAVTNDMNKFFSDAAFLTNLYNDFSQGGPGGGKTYPGLISLTNARIQFLENHSALNVSSPVISQVEALPAEVRPGETVWIRSTVVQTRDVKLFYRFGKEEIFVEIPMHDDGQHQDGQAGDGIFAAAVVFQRHSEMQYYIYAENDLIAALAPPRAEFEFYSMKAALDPIADGELLLNEIMASNTNYATDESGDFDDWMELINSTDREISCNGLFLSDNPDNPLKWPFPDTFIKARSYIVVWADEDGKRSGLHANFKLSKSGEHLGLYRSDSSSLDALDFPALNDNQSYGRCNRSWSALPKPSIAMPNDCGITSVDQTSDRSLLFVWPNPFLDYIEFSHQKDSPFQVQVIDAMGRLHFRKSYSSVSGSPIRIDSDQWPPGIYFLSLAGDQYHHTVKLVKSLERH